MKGTRGADLLGMVLGLSLAGDLKGFAQRRGAAASRARRLEADGDGISNLFVPDLLFFQVGNPNGIGAFVPGPVGNVLGKGRRLSDE